MRMRRRSIVALLLAVVLAGLIVPPFVNVSRYRARITDSISQALGRPVTLDSISLRLLPQPGFDLRNVAVGDDAAFSAEPIFRADEVTAYLRLSSLWRGRLEIARLHLKYPSLNLVRRPQGDWNLESLLWRASRSQARPAASGRPSARRFPYIEADSGRINLKFGVEKSVFALTEADFALWSPAEDAWRMRLEAKPVRTDTNITDTGVLRAEGSFRRADLLRDIPIQMQLTWTNGQLGQFTKLIYGRDRGWRGGLQFSAKLDGTPAALQTSVTGSLEDFRRYDIVRGEALRLEVRCSGMFSSTDQTLRGLNCQAPLQRGVLRVDGAITGANLRRYDLTVAANDIPVNSLVSLARHTKSGLPDDLSATGAVSAAFTGHREETEAHASWSGTGSASQVVLRSRTLDKNLDVGALRFFAGATEQAPAKKRRTAPSRVTAMALTFEPFEVPLGASVPAGGTASISPEGYTMRLRGEAELSRMLQVARATGLFVPRFGIFGPAKIDVTLSGEWRGFTQPQASGTAQLHATRAEVPGIASPVLIQSSQLEMANNRLRFHDLTAQIGKTMFTGQAEFLQRCPDATPCESHFDVQADTISLDDLNAQLNPAMKQWHWYAFFGGVGESSALGGMRASGRLAAKRLLAGPLTATKVSTGFTLDSGRLVLSNMRAELLGGSQAGEWEANFTGKQAVYSGKGTVSKIAANQLTTLLRAPLGSGSISGSYDLTMKGWTASELWASATAAADFEWRTGLWRNVQLSRGALRSTLPASSGPALQFSLFTGHVTLAERRFGISASRLQTPGGVYTMTGWVANNLLALQLERGNSTAYLLRGTLQNPHVEPALVSSGALEQTQRRAPQDRRGGALADKSQSGAGTSE